MTQAGLVNPYGDGRGQWLRGSLHGHSRPNSRCASLSLEEGVRRYVELGAQFAAITDHDWVTDLQEVQRRYPDLILLRGFEHSGNAHVVFVGEQVPALLTHPLSDALAMSDGLLTLISHPQAWPEHPTWTPDRFRALERLPDGIEIYNGHYGTPRLRARGLVPQYTPFWDQLLTAGCRVWGFANDDLHDPADLGNAFNMVLVDEPTPQAIVRAAKRGRFYASTGLLLEDVAVTEDTVRVSVRDECAGRFIGPGGRVLARSIGRVFVYTVVDEDYVRFEAQGAPGLLFLQPIYHAVALEGLC